MRIAAALLLALFAACASDGPAPPPPNPDWDAIPAGVVDAFCRRLQAEGVAAVAIVNTTQPLASTQTMVALASSGRRRANAVQVAAALQAAQKTIPINSGGACRWTAIDLRQRRSDQMIVELSAPLPNPFVPNTAGMFVRLSLGGEHASWYWISLVPHPAGWSVGFIQSLAL